MEAQPGLEESPVEVPAASVSTDKADFAQGSTVTITAEGFDKGSTIEFTIVDDPTDPGADGDVDDYGSFYATDGTPDALDATPLLTAFYELSRFDQSFPNCVSRQVI